MEKFCAAVARKLLLATVLIFALSSCAASPLQPWHSFSINGWFDGWAAKINLLEYKYGNQHKMTHRVVTAGAATLGYSVGVSGRMPVGDFIYVKWQIKETGEIIEDTVDLRTRLPKNMEGYRLTFTIEGRQLSLFLVTPIPKRSGDPPLLPTTESRYHLTYEIYPMNSYNK